MPIASQPTFSVETLSRFKSTVQEMREQVSDIRKRLLPLQENLQKDELNTSRGVSLLEVKYHTLLSYISNYTFYLLLKLHGKKVEDHPVVEKLVAHRVYLEKMKPLEGKLRYQIDKVLKAAKAEQDSASGGILSYSQSQDPLVYKPNPSDFINSEAVEQSQIETDQQSSVYRPPKIAPTYYDDSHLSNKTKLSQRSREKASKSRILNELRAQYDDRPEEFTAQGTGYASKEVGNEMDEKWADRETFEEENFVRLNMTRQDKKLRKMIEKRGSSLRFQDEFNNLDADFNEISGLSNVVQAEDKQGKGVLRKQRVSSTILESDANSKRKIKNVDEFIREEETDQFKKSIFKRQVKRLKQNKKN